jgi:hypothetical protein
LESSEVSPPYTIDDLERFLRWAQQEHEIELVLDEAGVVLKAKLSNDPDAWTRVKSLADLVETYYEDFPSDLAVHREEIPVPVPGARRSLL